MTLAKPHRGVNPLNDYSWPAALVSLVDRSLGCPARFRRLVVLLVLAVFLLGAVVLTAVLLHVPELLVSFWFRRP